MNAEIKVGPEKLGQAALHSRGLEDSRRLRRQGHNTHFKVKSCKALIRSGRAGRSGKRGSSAAIGLALWPNTSLASSDRSGSRLSSVLTSPLARSLGLCCEARQPGLESGPHQGGEVAPLGGWMQLKPRKAFFRNPGLSFSAVASPHPAKWIAPSISSPVLWVQWNVPLPLRSAVRVAGDARPVGRESPGRDGFARPRAALPTPSVIPLRAILVPPFPVPRGFQTRHK